MTPLMVARRTRATCSSAGAHVRLPARFPQSPASFAGGPRQRWRGASSPRRARTPRAPCSSAVRPSMSPFLSGSSCSRKRRALASRSARTRTVPSSFSRCWTSRSTRPSASARDDTFCSPPALVVSSATRVELEHELDRGFDASNLALHYQPIVDLRD
jgi:hypothetical protein